MRADRLVAILLMLQRRGSITAADVATELEISERTARRDLDALGAAGLPVYAQRGRGGGWRLAGGGSTDLSGLSEQEVRALFLVAGPRAGAAPDLRAALRKLVRALPEPFQAQAEAAASRMVIEPAGWGRGPGMTRPTAHLDLVQQAVVGGRCLSMVYERRDRERSERVVHPLGIAAKGALWYLIADTPAGLRTFRIDRILSASTTEEPVVQPPGFDLDAAWQLISDEIRDKRHPFRVRAIARDDMLGILRIVFDDGLRIGTPAGAGWVNIELRDTHRRALVTRLAGFGASVRVLDDAEVAADLGDIARQLLDVYPSASGAER